MAEISNELLYGVLKQMQQEIRLLKDGQGEIKQELVSIRGQLISVNQDISNVYAILSRHDERLDRIERRLDLRELAEAPQPYDPNA